MIFIHSNAPFVRNILFIFLYNSFILFCIVRLISLVRKRNVRKDFWLETRLNHLKNGIIEHFCSIGLIFHPIVVHINSFSSIDVKNQIDRINADFVFILCKLSSNFTQVGIPTNAIYGNHKLKYQINWVDFGKFYQFLGWIYIWIITLSITCR